jgi:hypothetical protein
MRPSCPPPSTPIVAPGPITLDMRIADYRV